MNHTLILIFFLLIAVNVQAADVVLREDWKETPAALPITQEHVANPLLQQTPHGPGGKGIKKSHHDKPADDPFYVWSGQCAMNWALSLKHRKSFLDLTTEGAKIRFRTKQGGGRNLHVLVCLPGDRWFVSDQSVPETRDWMESELLIADMTWRKFDVIRIAAGEKAPDVSLKRVDEVGFTDLEIGGGSKACSRVDWIEVTGTAVPRPAVKKTPSVKTKRAEAILPDSVVAHEGVVYTSYGKRELQLDLYRPKAEGSHPGVVFIHGGGWYKGDRSSYIPMAQQLAAAGYVCATIEYRLAGESPFPAALHDCKAAVRWMRRNAEKYGIDPEQTACIGGSAGGHLSGLVATSGQVSKLNIEAEPSSAVQAAVVMAGKMDLTDAATIETAANDPRKRLITFMGGEWESKAKQNYIDASPQTHVDKNTPPMLFLDGEFDNPEVRYVEFRKNLDALGIVNEYHTIANAPHPYWVMHPFFAESLAHVRNFLNRTLKEKN